MDERHSTNTSSVPLFSLLSASPAACAVLPATLLLKSLSPILCYGILVVPLLHLCQPLRALSREALTASLSPPKLAALHGSVCGGGFAVPWTQKGTGWSGSHVRASAAGLQGRTLTARCLNAFQGQEGTSPTQAGPTAQRVSGSAQPDLEQVANGLWFLKHSRGVGERVRKAEKLKDGE